MSSFENVSQEVNEAFEFVSATFPEMTLDERAVDDDTSEMTIEEEQYPFSELTNDGIEINSALVNNAKNGDGRSLYYIGSLYHHRQEYTKAMAWLQLAAEKKNPASLYMIGLMHEDGQSVEADYLAAMSWYLKAARLGEPKSCDHIGNMFENGLGVPEDGQLALDWYKASATNTTVTVEAIEEDYITVARNDKSILELVVESMEVLEQQVSKRWNDKMRAIVEENQRLTEEVSSLMFAVSDVVNNSHPFADYRHDICWITNN